MTELQIKIKYTKGETIIKEFSVLSDMFVEDLRIIIEEELKVPAYKQNLIFKGKMLHNEKKLEDYKISNNDLILLVEKIGETGDKTGLNKISGQTGVGAPGQINYDLLKQPMGFSGNLDQVIEAMKIPEIAGQVETMFDDPNIINAMMQNPSIKAACEMFPGTKDLLTKKEFLRSMFQPENLERIKRIQEGNASPEDLLSGLNINNLNNNNLNNNNLNNNNNMFGMPMGNPLLMNPMMMGMPNLFGQRLFNNNNNLNNNNLNNNNNFNNNNTILTNEQLKEKYKEQISKIKDMGFSNEEEIINALKKTNGIIDAAIERLISGLK